MSTIKPHLMMDFKPQSHQAITDVQHTDKKIHSEMALPSVSYTDYACSSCPVIFIGVCFIMWQVLIFEHVQNFPTDTLGIKLYGIYLFYSEFGVH